MTDIEQRTVDKQVLLDKYLSAVLKRAPAGSDVNPRIVRRPSIGDAPLSFGQQQLWLLAQLLPDRPVYNECVTIHLPGPLNVAALERSFNEVLRRHEAWHTTFPTVDGQPVARVHPASPLMLTAIDLRGLLKAERETRALQLATKEANRSFDLAQGPLLRALLVRLDDAEHRLFLTLHHIVFDGVAMYQVFLPELRALYEASVLGQPSPLPAPPIQYGDYAYWQRESAREGALASQLAYWKRQLADAPTTLDLPTDRPRPPVQTFRGSMHSFELSEALSEALKTLGRREGVTLYITLLAAFNALLYRYSGQEDILIGTAVAGRKHPELQGLLGFFLNTVVMRTNLAGNPSFRDLLRRVCDVTLDAYAHEDVPFEYVVKEVQPERDLARNPLFQVLLTLEPPLPALPSGWTLTQMDVETDTAKFDLSLELDDRPGGIIGRFEYSTDLFDAATIARMVGHWQTLLKGIVADPSRRLSELPLLTEAERHELLVGWNREAVSPDVVGGASREEDMCLHHLFEAQVERTPDTVAVVFETEQLTYHELNARANRLAHALLGHGVGPDTLVGLYVERSAEMVIALLAILKAGGAYVPLDPAYPAARLALMLQDAEAPVLVTTHGLQANLPDHAATVVTLDGAEVQRQPRVDNPVGAAQPAHLAYVIYTSGSTGRPKGVEIPHRAVVNFLTSMRQQPGLGAQDTLLAVTTLSFDIAALEIFLPLTVGARLVIASRSVAADGARLAETLIASGATVMQATPATWRLLLAAGWRGSEALTVLCGGEALPRELANALLDKCKALWNMYGPTETTIWSTMQRIDSTDGPIAIGRPIANTDIYILDKDLNPVPVGVPGELHIGGAGLARGYRNHPDLTAAKFIRHPFNTEPVARLYKTGDLARYRSDDTIECLGRIDHQVKVRGYRIELGEIEALLGHHPAISDAVVVAREDEPGDRRLVAYLVATGTGQSAPSSADLRRFLGAHVPDYMVPMAFVPLDALPLTPNGKVDRSALPAPSPAAAAAGEEAPPLTVHYQLIHIWEDLLGVRGIGLKDSFFDLGGHSLLAVRLLDRIERDIGKKIPLATLFTAATIEQLTQVLLRHDAGSSEPWLVKIQDSGSRRPFFFLHGDYDGGGFYCATIARHLGADQPFYALQPHGLSGRAVPLTVEAMAADYLQALRSVQPEGPYLLGGFCLAGLVAFELARQLRADGQTVDAVVLIDTVLVTTHRRVARAVITRVGNLIGLSPYAQRDCYLLLRHVEAQRERLRGAATAVRVRVALRTAVRRVCARGPGPAWTRALRARHVLRRRLWRVALAAATAPRRRDVEGLYQWASAGYRPRRYPGQVVLCLARDEVAVQRGDLAKGWRKVAPRLAVHAIPGTHLTSVTTHAHALAAQMAVYLKGV